MLRTGRLPAPHRGRSSSASTPGSRPTPGVLLPGTLASPRTGLTPAGCRELVARLPRRSLPSVTSAPELLDAHSRGIATARSAINPLLATLRVAQEDSSAAEGLLPL